MRSLRYRYIRYAGGGEELYDHAADPNEWKNLAGDTAYAQVQKSLINWLPEINRMPGMKRL